MQRGLGWRIRRPVCRLSLAAALLWLTPHPCRGQSAEPSPAAALASRAPALVGNLILTVGKSMSIDSPRPIKRVAASDEGVAECVAIGPNEILVNGKAPGEASIVVWQDDDTRARYDLVVRPSASRLNAVRAQIARESGGADVELTLDNDTVFVRGTATDGVSAERILSIASTLGKTVNLLRVATPPVEPQVLLMVRFASVSRTASKELGASLASGAFHQSTALGIGPPVSQDGGQTFSLSQAVNVLLFRKDINLLAAIQALESKNLLETLAEPNLLVINGTQAHFVAGGEFPYPMVQPGSSGNSVTIAFKEYGIRLGFLPVITPRGTIRLQVAPEVSALDYSNSVTVAGTTVPGTSTRRVQTEVELDSGQTFVVDGLLDHQTTENLSKVPGIGSLPVLGKLFQSKSLSQSHSELMILITPDIVRPIPAGQPLPDIDGKEGHRSFETGSVVRQPGIAQTGPVPVHAPAESVPFEMLFPMQKKPPPSAPTAGPGTAPGH